MWYLILSIPDLCTLTYFVSCTDKIPSMGPFLSHQRTHRGPYGPPSSSNWTLGVSVSVLLRKRIATCNFPGGGPDPCPYPLCYLHKARFKVQKQAHLIKLLQFVKRRTNCILDDSKENSNAREADICRSAFIGKIVY